MFVVDQAPTGWDALSPPGIRASWLPVVGWCLMLDVILIGPFLNVKSFHGKFLDEQRFIFYNLSTMKLDTIKIRARIKEKGLTIEQAAPLMGLTRTNLQMILKNQSTLLARIDQIAHGIDLNPKDILI